MPQPLIITLLLCVFVLPILGAVILRILTPRLAPVQLYGAAVLLLAVVVASVLVLARSDIPNLQIGNLSILLPVTASDSFDPQLLPTPPAVQPPTLPAVDTSVPATTVPAATGLPSTTATTAPPTAAATQTATATPTPEPTVAPTATPAPTAVPPTAAPAPPAAQRKYTVQPGDTLLSIARQFNTTVTAIVEANNLTPQQADALRVGQELVIP